MVLLDEYVMSRILMHNLSEGEERVEEDPSLEMQTTQPPEEENMGLSLGRLEALSDGVCAIAITILVLLIEVPSASEENLMAALWKSGHVFAAYITSFVLICIYWWRHHTMSHYLKKTDKVLTWLNLMLLLWIAFVPFPTDLLIEHFRSTQVEIAIVLYGSVHLLCGSLLYAIWWYATHEHRLVAEDLDPQIILGFKKLLFFNMVIYAVSMGVSFVNSTAALLIYIAIPLLNLVPHRKGIDVVNLSKHGR